MNKSELWQHERKILKDKIAALEAENERLRNPWTYIDPDSVETLPLIERDGISKIIILSIQHCGKPDKAYRAWLEPSGKDNGFSWAVCYQELLGYEAIRPGDVAVAWQPWPSPATEGE